MLTRQGIGIKLYMYKGISMADCVTQRNSRAAIVIQWYNVLCLRVGDEEFMDWPNHIVAPGSSDVIDAKWWGWCT